MKSSVIATVFVLAFAQGIFAQEAIDLQKVNQYFEEMSTKMTEDLIKVLGNSELASQAQTFLEDKKAHLEPLASQLQEQLNHAAVNMEDHIKPLAASVQEQVQPMMDNLKQRFEEVLQRMREQPKAFQN